MAEDTQASWLIAEHQVQKACIASGMMALGMGAGTFFLYFLLHALEAATKISTIGLPGTMAIIVASLLFSKIVVGRLSQYAIVTILSIATFIGGLLGSGTEMDVDEIVRKRTETNLTGLVSLSIIGLLGIAFFLSWRWTCADANPTGGFMYAACLGSDGGIAQTMQIQVLRLSGGAWGLGGVLLTIVALLEARAAWRESWVQRRFRNSGIYFWLRPMKDFESSLTEDFEDEE